MTDSQVKNVWRTEIPDPIYSSQNGLLFHKDCMDILPLLVENTIDMVFADPPFNLDKDYGKGVEDARCENDYLKWCYGWMDECVRVLKPGGAFFLYNLPKWNMSLGHYLGMQGLVFRHWIAVDIKFSFPIRGRLYPSHYSLLYFTKGSPKVYNKIRVPIETCRHCKGDLRNYGGHRKSLNPNGINLSDVWSDISPVRHKKFKSSKRGANQLSTKLLNRCIQMTTNEGDLVLDPFGGAGTTFDVCERINRQWIGAELGDCDPIIERLEGEHILPHHTDDYIEET